jgi:hypothetical protein
MYRALALARSGDHAQAAAQARAAIAEARSDGQALYNAACVCAQAAAAASRDESLAKDERTRLAEQYAAQAVAYLLKARAAGWYRGAAVEHMQKDPDLAPLRDRDDYKELLRSVSSGRP